MEYVLHALVSAAVIIAVIYGLRRGGILPERKQHGFDWYLFVVVLVVVGILNFVWPWPG